MPIDKIVPTVAAALAGIADRATIMVSGFGGAGAPDTLLAGLAAMGLHGLTVIANNAGAGPAGLAPLLQAGSVAKLICSFPRGEGAEMFEVLYMRGEIELELCPQGSLSERIRAGGAGIGGFYTRTSVGTPLAEGKETKVLSGALHVLELPLHADFALIHADRADRWGNLTYAKTARNYAPAMATAATTTIVEARRMVDLGSLDPECVVTPGIYVQRVVHVPVGPPP